MDLPGADLPPWGSLTKVTWDNLIPFLIALFIASVIGAVIKVLVGRYSTQQNYRDAASLEEIKVRALFVKELYQGILDRDRRILDIEQERDKRQDELEKELRRIYDELRVCKDDINKQVEACERRYRHLVNNLVFYAQFLRDRLLRLGQQTPKFTGFTTFEREGGEINPNWLRSFDEEPDKEQ